MTDLREWFKGITFFLFVTLLFYFLWENIFSNIIDFVGSDVFGIGSEAVQSIAIMKTMAWLSFIALYLGIGGVFLIYSFIVGSSGTVKTSPLEFLKAIGLWAVLTPFLVFIYGLVHFMVGALNDSNVMDASLETTATQFSWIFAIIILTAIVIVPFVFVLKGYGISLMGENEALKGGVNG